MSHHGGRRKKAFWSRIISAITALIFLFGVVLPPNLSFAQSWPTTVLNLPIPGTMVTQSEAFVPLIVKGLTIYPDNPLEFDFIVDTGTAKLKDDALKQETTKLIKYFLATLTIPEDDVWVNLSPYEKDRIIPNNFGMTEMGKDLLAQDYLLKQLTASLMYPEEESGKKFWDRVYAKAQTLYGTTEIPLNTFNKVWIVPDKATIYEHENNAFIIESHLKVMLEEDYEALEENLGSEELAMDQLSDEDAKTANSMTSDVVKEVLIPEIEKEVNEGKTFANLRQIYNSMILATWYKERLKDSLLAKVYADKSKVKGVDVEDKDIKEKIYSQYLEAFKKGVYDYIKEDYDPATQEIIPRKYFSGGFTTRTASGQKLNSFIIGTLMTLAPVLGSPDHARFSHAKTPSGEFQRAHWAAVDVGAKAVNMVEAERIIADAYQKTAVGPAAVKSHPAGRATGDQAAVGETKGARMAREKWFMDGHPSTLYHAYKHTTNSGEIEYAFALRRDLREDQTEFLSEVAYRHDFHPQRVVNTQALVPNTLDLFEKDFNRWESLKGLTDGSSVLIDELGWDVTKYLMARAIIARSESPFVDDASHENKQAYAEKATTPVQEYRKALTVLKDHLTKIGEDEASIKATLKFVIEEAAYFTRYVDVLSWYMTEDFEGALRVVRDLEREKGFSENFLLKGTYAFLQVVGRASEDFQKDRDIAAEFGIEGIEFMLVEQALDFMPEGYKGNFERNLAGFKAIKEALDAAPLDFESAKTAGRRAALGHGGQKAHPEVKEAHPGGIALNAKLLLGKKIVIKAMFYTLPRNENQTGEQTIIEGRLVDVREERGQVILDLEETTYAGRAIPGVYAFRPGFNYEEIIITADQPTGEDEKSPEPSVGLTTEQQYVKEIKELIRKTYLNENQLIRLAEAIRALKDLNAEEELVSLKADFVKLVENLANNERLTTAQEMSVGAAIVGLKHIKAMTELVLIFRVLANTEHLTAAGQEVVKQAIKALIDLKAEEELGSLKVDFVQLVKNLANIEHLTDAGQWVAGWMIGSLTRIGATVELERLKPSLVQFIQRLANRERLTDLEQEVAGDLIAALTRIKATGELGQLKFALVQLMHRLANTEKLLNEVKKRLIWLAIRALGDIKAATELGLIVQALANTEYLNEVQQEVVKRVIEVLINIEAKIELEQLKPVLVQFIQYLASRLSLTEAVREVVSYAINALEYIDGKAELVLIIEHMAGYIELTWVVEYVAGEAIRGLIGINARAELAYLRNTLRNMAMLEFLRDVLLTKKDILAHIGFDMTRQMVSSPGGKRSYGLEVEIGNNESQELRTPSTTSLDSIQELLKHLKRKIREMNWLKERGYYWNMHINVGLKKGNVKRPSVSLSKIIHYLIYPANPIGRNLYNLARLRGNNLYFIKTDIERKSDRPEQARLEIKEASIGIDSDIPYLIAVMEFLDGVAELEEQERTGDLERIAEGLKKAYLGEQEDQEVYWLYLTGEKGQAQDKKELAKIMEDKSKRLTKAYDERRKDVRGNLLKKMEEIANQLKSEKGNNPASPAGTNAADRKSHPGARASGDQARVLTSGRTLVGEPLREYIRNNLRPRLEDIHRLLNEALTTPDVISEALINPKDSPLAELGRKMKDFNEWLDAEPDDPLANILRRTLTVGEMIGPLPLKQPIHTGRLDLHNRLTVAYLQIYGDLEDGEEDISKRLLENVIRNGKEIIEEVLDFLARLEGKREVFVLEGQYGDRVIDPNLTDPAAAGEAPTDGTENPAVAKRHPASRMTVRGDELRTIKEEARDASDKLSEINDQTEVILSKIARGEKVSGQEIREFLAQIGVLGKKVGEGEASETLAMKMLRTTVNGRVGEVEGIDFRKIDLINRVLNPLSGNLQLFQAGIIDEEGMSEIRESLASLKYRQQFLAWIQEQIQGQNELQALIIDGRSVIDPTGFFAKDQAAVGEAGQKEHPGGIALNAKLLDLQIKRDGNGVPLPLLEQPIGEMRIEGFIPVIINITPAPNLNFLLGVSDQEKQPSQSSNNLDFENLTKFFIREEA